MTLSAAQLSGWPHVQCELGCLPCLLRAAGTGKDAGNRHPKVEDNVLIGAGATVLGNITVGKGAQVLHFQASRLACQHVHVAYIFHRCLASLVFYGRRLDVSHVQI